MASSGMNKFKEAYPDRVINCGIQEANMFGVAAGLSEEGFVPFVHSFSAFASRRITDQIFVSGIYARQNVRVVGSDPGLSAGPNGSTHISLEDMGILRSLPGTVILDPCDLVQLKAVTEQCVVKNNGLGSAVAEVIAEEGIRIPFKRMGVPDSVGEVGTLDYLLRKFGMDASAVAETVKELLIRKK